MKLQLTNTKKLFYDRYLYKVAIRNSISSIFRDKNFKYARSVLDELQLQYELGKPLSYRRWLREDTVLEQSFLDAKLLLQIFVKKKNYTLRCEHPILNIYTNDEKWALDLVREFDAQEYSSPSKNIDISLLQKNVIIMDKPFPFEYKVTLGDKVDPNSANWFESNRDKVRISTNCLETIKAGNNPANMYIYVRDSKVLQLINLVLGNGISRIDKIVSVTNIDK